MIWFFRFSFNGTWWLWTLTSTGTYTSVHHVSSPSSKIVNKPVITGSSIRQESTLCVPIGTPRCTVITSSAFTFTGTATLTTVHPGPIGSDHLAGGGTLSAFGGTAPFSALNGKTMTVSSLSTTFT